jgi:hypothetical protein
MKTPSAETPLVVSTDGTAGPYITVATDQLDPVVQALRAQDIPIQETDEDAVLIDGRPALAVIDLGHDADVDRIQAVLDRLAAEWRGQQTEGEQPATSHQELIVKCDPPERAELIRRIEGDPPQGWKRRTEIEQRMGKMRAARARAYCFSKTFEPGQREVAVWLQPRGSDEFYVTTIIPLQAREVLSVEQYNRVLDDFKRTFIEPLMQGLKGHVFNYQAPTEPTIEDLLSIASMRCLKTFSATAIKGMLHPLDTQRWHAFIARTHLDNVVLDPVLLSKWLESQGWPEEKRLRLIEDYEHGRSLLTVYDEERVDR